MARPTKRTPERQQVLFDAIRNGCTRRAAAQAAGVDEATLYRWAERSASFASELSRAEAESEVSLVGIVRQAAATDWRAAMTLLERRWPNDWGRREKVDMHVDIEGYTRQRARELGLDEDLAVQHVRAGLRVVA